MLRFLIDHRSAAGSDAAESAELAHGIGSVVDLPACGAAAALAGGSVDFAISGDERLHREALRAGVEQDRILNHADARSWLRSLAGNPLPPPSPVESLPLSRLDRRDPLLKRLCAGDAGLERRLAAIADTDARAWICRERPGGCAGLAIGRLEDQAANLELIALDRGASLRRSGELLLAALFAELHSRRCRSVEAAIPSGQIQLAALMRGFGFERRSGAAQRQGWIPLRKTLIPSGAVELDPLKYHRWHGPPAAELTLAPVYIAPLGPAQHRRLFAEPNRQLRLPLGIEAPAEPTSPALRKAWISNLRNRALPDGAAVFFYRTGDVKGITALGVVEASRRTANTASLTRWVGPRGAYSSAELARLAQRGALAIRFRHARLMREPIPLAEFGAGGRTEAGPRGDHPGQKRACDPLVARAV